VGAQSGVSKNVSAGTTVFGSPALPIREAKEQLAHVRRLPKLLERVKLLESGEQNSGTPPKSLPPES